MQVTQELREFWAKNRERTDVNELARLTGKDHTTISKILSGASERTGSAVVKIITQFYKKREKFVKTAVTID